MIPLRRNNATNDIAAAIAHTTVLSRADGNAEHRRPIPTLGAGPNRQAIATACQEPGNTDHHQRRDDQGDEMVGVEDDLTDRQLPSDRWSNAFAGQVATPPARDQDADHDQQLGDAERGHGDHQPGRVAKATDQRELDDTPATMDITSPAASPRRYGHPQNRMNAAENAVGTVPKLGLCKVDHSIGPIDQRHADSHHRVQPPSTRPCSHKPNGRPKKISWMARIAGDRGERDNAGRVDVADTRASHAPTVAVDRDAGATSARRPSAHIGRLELVSITYIRLRDVDRAAKGPGSACRSRKADVAVRAAEGFRKHRSGRNAALDRPYRVPVGVPTAAGVHDGARFRAAGPTRSCAPTSSIRR